MMLFSMLLIVSVVLMLLLVYFIRLPYKKNPIYLIILTSGTAVLFAYITSLTLSIWLGILFFFGIILSGTILIGKRKVWLDKKEVNSQAQAPKRSFHKITKHFENPSGRSIFDEEKSPLYIPRAVVDNNSTSSEEGSFEDFLIKKQNDETTSLVERHSELDSETKLPVDLEIGIPTIEEEEIAEPIVPDLSYEVAMQEVATSEIGLEFELEEDMPIPMEEDSTLLENEVEELSDQWMAKRLDSLFASEEQQLSNSFSDVQEEEMVIPNFDDLSKPQESIQVEQDARSDFEDISALYFKKQRGEDIDGAKK